MESTLKFQRGDIYFVRLDNRTGSEQSGTRPAVILQNEVGNSCSPTLIVATLTSQTEKKATQPTHCLVEPEGLEPSIVQAEQMIRVIQGTSGLDREMIQQMVNENKEALLTAQTNLADSEKKLKEIEEQNQKAERNCSDLFTWASTYKGASFERRQAILKQFIKEVRVGRDYNIEIVLNVPLDEFEEFKRHAASAGRGKNQKNKSQNPQKVGRCTSNAGIVVLDKTAGETISIVPKNAAHAILRC